MKSKLASSEKPNLKRRLFFSFKILMTLSLCGFIIWKGDWHHIAQVFGEADPLLLLVVFIGMILCVTISAFKWQLLLDIHGIRNNFGRLHRYYFTASFFNNFLPSHIGGDAYRIFKTWHNERSKTGAIVAVFTERASGIWALIALALMGGILVINQQGPAISGFKAVLAVFGVLTFVPIIGLFFYRHIFNWGMRLKKLPQKIRHVFELAEDYRNQRSKTLQVIAISFGFHLFTLSWMLVLCYAVGSSTTLDRLVLGVAIGNLAAMLPISINGIGLLDGSFIYVMGKLGLGYDTALIMMLIMRAFQIPISLIGGFFYIKEKQTSSVTG